MEAQNITLYNTQGGSNKVYKSSIEQSGDAWVVNYSHGPRGGTLRSGTKTQAPVDGDKAQKIYDKLVKSKMAKGYVPEEAQESEYVSAFVERDSGIRPQLLNECDQQRKNEIILSQAWVLQEKHDGERRLVHVTPDGVVCINKKGLTIGGAKTIIDSVSALPSSTVIDGEAIGDVLHAFDILELDGRCLRSTPYIKRLEILESLSLGEHVKVVVTARTLDEKQAFFDRCVEENAEGVVGKLAQALFTEGRPNKGGDQLKFKFYATASVIVTGHNVQRSIQISVLEDGVEVFVGNCTIAGSTPIPAIASIIEVRYLYARKGGSLYQPNFLFPRTDTYAEDCIIEQLKYKRAA